MLSAEIIAIGSELLTPTKTDTNSLWLTEKLNEIGIEVKLKTIVGDDSNRLEESIRDALKRSDIVITTGGLGPTEDDITRTVSAKAVERELVYRDELESDLRERFRRWGREMPEINKRQAFVIDGCDVLPNPNGSAVGMLVQIGEKTFGILPGPPKENQPMFNDFIYPKLREKAGGIITRRRFLRISGMGESAVDEAIAPIYKSYEGVETSILFSRSEIELHLSFRGNSAEFGDRILNELTTRIVEKLGVAVFYNGRRNDGRGRWKTSQTRRENRFCCGELHGRFGSPSSDGGLRLVKLFHRRGGLLCKRRKNSEFERSSRVD